MKRGLVRLDVALVAAVPVAQPQPAQSPRSLLDGDEAVEHIEADDAGILAMGDQFPPGAGVPHGVKAGLDEAEVGRAAVRPDDPAPAKRLGFVFVVALARQEDFESKHRIVGPCVAQLARDGAR